MKMSFAVTVSVILIVAMGTVQSSALVAAANATAASASGNMESGESEPPFFPSDALSNGTVIIAGERVDYRAIAGNLIVHPKGWDDATSRSTGHKEDVTSAQATSSMFYAAYFKQSDRSANRPITFIYNGGPGSSSMWLHIGAFAPKRVSLNDRVHTSAPYELVNNAYSLLNISDLVFIDAPGTGFSRVWGKDKEKAFYGVDADAHAFAEFIMAFLTKFDRWNAPKYLCGESYGTPRSAVLANLLTSQYNVDVNGVIMLSQILNYDLGAGASEFNPGTDQPYIVALPAYAAAAWYHNRLREPRPKDLPTFLHQAEQFATTDYAEALQAGSTLADSRRQAIAAQMSDFLGLPVDYIVKSNLRLDARQFEKMLLRKEGLEIGGIDARFIGPPMDPLSKGTQYDPTMSAVSSAAFGALNEYVRKTLGYTESRKYKASVDLILLWAWDREQPQNAPTRVFGIANVMPDLASAMKANPDLKVMVNGGYYDLGTSYYEGWYEMHHLPIPARLQDNIEYHYYEAGHMAFLHEPSLKQMHDNITDFIRRTAAPK